MLWLLLIVVTLSLFLAGTYLALRKIDSDFAGEITASGVLNPISVQHYQRMKETILELFIAAALVSILSFIITALFMRRNNLLLDTLVQQRTTELTQANAELRTAKEQVEGTLAAIPDVIIQVDEAGIIMAANYNAELLLGYTRQELVGMEIGELIPHRLREKHWRGLQRMMAARVSAIKSLGHLIVLNKKGDEIDMEININTFEMGGRWVAIAGLRDIRDRLNTEREKIKLQQQLAQASKMRTIGQLIGGIAHDFNNILTSIMGFAELAARTAPTDNDKLSQYMEAIRQSSLRASELVKQMIAFSRGDIDLLPSVQKEGAEISSAPSDRPHHLLIVDDEKSITAFMVELLEGWGYRASHFNSAIEALIAFEQNPHEYDLVITDQTMPQMRGTELTRSLQAIRPGIPVILYSGYDNEVNDQNYHHHGIYAFFPKPLDTGELHETIRQRLV